MRYIIIYLDANEEEHTEKGAGPFSKCKERLELLTKSGCTILNYSMIRR